VRDRPPAAVPFLGEELQRRIEDGRGVFALFRHVLPLDVPI